MIGTSTPRRWSLPTISGTAAAAASVLTVTRTSSLPAWASCATWSAVASASAVSVFVIDWTTIGWSPPTRTPPTSTVTVGRRVGRRSSGPVVGRSAAVGPLIGRSLTAGELAGDIEERDPHDHRHEEAEADDVGEPFGGNRESRPDDRLDEDDEHPSAIERRERQDVDEREVRGEQAGQEERGDRAALPEDVAHPDGDAHRTLDRRRLGRPADERVAE